MTAKSINCVCSCLNPKIIFSSGFVHNIYFLNKISQSMNRYLLPQDNAEYHSSSNEPRQMRSFVRKNKVFWCSHPYPIESKYNCETCEHRTYKKHKNYSLIVINTETAFNLLTCSLNKEFSGKSSSCFCMITGTRTFYGWVQVFELLLAETSGGTILQ